MAARTAMTAPTSVSRGRDTQPDGADLSQKRLRPDRTMSEVLATVAAVVAVVVVTAVMLRRVGHPYELEWLEGGSVEHVRRVLHGRSLYPAPSVDFVSYPYPPLYWWASAGAASVLGVGFLPLRLVSLIASVATMGLLGAIVRRETGRFSAGVVAAGIYAASFRAGGSWFDVARVDALFLALFVAAVLAATAARSGRTAAVAGVLLGLSVLTKQTSAMAALPMLMWLAIRRPRVGASMTAAAVGVAGGVSVWLNAASHGWYRFATIDELLGHPIDHGAIARFWRVDIGHRVWPTILLVALAAIVAARDRERVTSPDRAIVIAAALGLIAAAYASRLHSSDFANVLMPAYAAAALFGGLNSLWLTLGGAAVVGIMYSLVPSLPGIRGTNFPGPREVAIFGAVILFLFFRWQQLFGSVLQEDEP